MLYVIPNQQHGQDEKLITFLKEEVQKLKEVSA